MTDTQRVEEASKRFPIGTPVRFFPVICDARDLENFEDAEVRSEPWAMGGQIVVKITGRAGGVSVQHLTPLPTPTQAPDSDVREKVARSIYFFHVEVHGFPNGLPTFDELPETERNIWLQNADAVLSVIPKATLPEVSEGGDTLEKLTAPESGWWAGIIDEHYSIGPFSSREEAIEEAARNELGYQDAEDGDDGDDEPRPQLLFNVAFCTTKPLKLSTFFDAKDWLEDREEAAAFDYIGEGGDELFVCSQEQATDLQARVRSAIDQWQAHHELSFRPWIFDEVSKSEDLALPVALDQPVEGDG